MLEAGQHSKKIQKKKNPPSYKNQLKKLDLVVCHRRDLLTNLKRNGGQHTK
jgi:hypothetical protein